MSFDAHTHLDFPAFDTDRDEVCARARAAGLSGWAIAGADPAHWDRVQRVARETGAVAALGVHPWWAMQLDEATAAAHLADLRRRAPAAIGETGLDHARARSAEQRARQRVSFRDHLALARELDRPVVLHIVRAYTEALQILRHDGIPAAGGMVHRWSGKHSQVRQVAQMGLHVSFGPELLNSGSLKECVKHVPSDKLLFETDAPDVPLAGKPRGEPADIGVVINEAARRRNDDPDWLAAVSGANARRLFGLELP